MYALQSFLHEIPILILKIILQVVQLLFCEGLVKAPLERSGRLHLPAPLAISPAGLGLDVIRKKGKLPRKTVSVRAPNEYAVEIFEMHADTIMPGQRVIIIDDLIATGSSSIAAIDLVRVLKGEPVGFGAVIDLGFLGGMESIRKAHPEVDVFSIVRYD